MAVNSGVLINAGLEFGLIDAETVAELRVKARRERGDLIEIITLHGRFPLAALYQALAAQKGLPFLDSRDLLVDEALFRRIPPSLLQRRRCLPVRSQGDDFFLATADPEDFYAAEQISRILGQTLTLAVAEPRTIEARLRTAFRQLEADAAAEIDSVAELDEILRQAYVNRASDVHFAPGKEGMKVRFRVDGRLSDYPGDYSPEEAGSLLSRVKVLSGMDISEQRLPQDGGMSHRVAEGREFDIRVAAMPTRWGERGTLRLLEQDAVNLTLTKLGMGDTALARFREAIVRPHGMVLITGPTGSGKSTTLYAALQEIVSPDINVLTVEDPIEKVIAGISQVQVGSKMSFAGALRGFLRHDPDVIMVGEIRDPETTDVALKAALNGHMVFSTLHTNSAVSAVTRLRDIGAERFLIASTLVAVIAQRLVRRLCSHCKKARPADEKEKVLLEANESALQLYEPSGCPICTGTGYRGRIGLFETLWIDEALAHTIAEGGSEGDLIAQAKDYVTLWDDGRDKVIAGVTSLDEVLRTVGAIRPDSRIARDSRPKRGDGQV